MSAVKNLRAMFEQKGENSPPDRGRSPGVPFGKDHLVLFLCAQHLPAHSGAYAHSVWQLATR